MSTEPSALLGKLRDACTAGRQDEQIELLQSLVQCSLKLENRKSMNEPEVRLISKLLSDYSDGYKNQITSNELSTIVETSPSFLPTAVLSTLKLLRNICADVPRNQANILSTNVLTSVVSLITAITTYTPSHHHTSIPSPTQHDIIVKTTLQLLGNLCVGYPKGQMQIWSTFFPQVLKSILEVCGEIEMVFMVLHNCTCTNSQRRDELITSTDGLAILEHVTMATVEANSTATEWRSIFLTSFLKSTSLSCLHKHLLPSHRGLWIALLDVVCDIMEEEGERDGEGVWSICEESECVYLVTVWRGEVEKILSDEAAVLREVSDKDKARSLSTNTRQNVEAVHSSLRVLCGLSVRRNSLHHLQTQEKLLDTAVGLLRQLSLLDGSVSSGKHRSDLKEAASQKAHGPLFGMKRDLLQLISSLLYHCTRNQDKIRQLEAIPLLLNQCHIDHNNPYIMQWAVLTIRNLCEDNPTNQQLIAQLETQGVAEGTAQFDFGCEVQVGSDGKLKVKTRNTPAHH